MKPYWLENSNASPSHNGHAPDLSYITLDYAIQQMGGHGLAKAKRESLTPQAMGYRGAQMLKSLCIPRWKLFSHEAIIGKSELVEKIANVSYIASEDGKAKLASLFNSTPIRIPLSESKALQFEHPVDTEQQNYSVRVVRL